MKAVVIRAFGEPLQWEEVEVPAPGPGEALVQVMACGIDGTDLKLLDGFGYTPELPFIMGHEVAGVVAEIGDGVAGFGRGDRVVAYNFFTCGQCPLCLQHREQLCVDMGGVLGVKDKHGGYAEYVAVPSRQLVRVPEHVPWADAAVACDAGLTAFHAVDRAALSPGETIVIIGVGGVGSTAVQLAKGAGARVIAVEIAPQKEEWARRMGADEVLNPATADIATALRDLTGGLGADGVIDVVGTGTTMTAGVDALRHGGRLVIVGYTPEGYTLEGKYIAQNELEIIGTRAGRKQDLLDVAQLISDGEISSIVTEQFPMEEANAALGRLREGKTCGRIVLLTPAGRREA